MGSYVSKCKFFELPLRGRSHFDFSVKDEDIINTLAFSDYVYIQTNKTPSSDDLVILNQVFKLNPDIIFRDYSIYFDNCVDISYLSELTNLRSLDLNIWSKIDNLEVIEELNLKRLSLDCFNVKDYGFLSNVSSSIKDLTIILDDKTYKMDINDILHMAGLETLSIRNVKRGLSELCQFKHLKELNLRSVDIKDYSFLKMMKVNKIRLAFHMVEYFNTFGINESIEEVSLWMNKKLTDISFLLQFPKLKKIVVSQQYKVNTIPDLTGLTELEEFYFLHRDIEDIKKHCSQRVNIYTDYNPAEIF